MASAADEFFAKVPEFLAAFDHIHKNGCFLDAEFSGQSLVKGLPFSVSMKFVGLLPKKMESRKRGLGILLDPHVFVECLRQHIDDEALDVKSHYIEVKSSEGWRPGTSRTEIRLRVVFRPAKKQGR